MSIAALTGATPRPRTETPPPESLADAVARMRDEVSPTLVESILHDALAAQRVAIEDAVAAHLRGSKHLSFVSLAALLILFAGTWYLYRDVRSMMREDAIVPALAPAPPPKRAEQTEPRFDGIEDRIQRLEAKVQRVLELLEPQADVSMPPPGARRGT
jgi:hypothetical protein